MSDEANNPDTPIGAAPAQEDAPIIGYRNIVDDRRPTPWLDLLGLLVSVGAVLFFLGAAVVLGLLILGNDWTYDPWTELFFFVLSVISFYLSCLCALSYAGWVRYGRPGYHEEM